jgi:UDP-N-acetylmuramate--alanine ligase
MLLFETKKINGSSDVIHFVGIGGIGMSGIAEIMHNLGYRVQGSDSVESANTLRLKAHGIKILIGHNQSNIHKVSYVVLSSAIKSDNPEVSTAIAQKIPVIKRAEMLAELMRLKCSVAVSGSHGKTTTTSLVACLFESAGLNPTVINGGIINGKSTNAYLGSGRYLIAEADESDATFIQLPATVAVITNIDPEHLDFYGDFESLKASFRRFITNLPFYGFGVACIDHPVVRKLTESITERKIITYGINSDDANIKAYDITLRADHSIFSVKIDLPNLSGVLIKDVALSIPGRHNVLNCLAAIAIGIEMEFELELIKKSFGNFGGVKRRFTKLCDYRGASLIDDYAHHPVEIQATLSTARAVALDQSGKVLAIFQPHRYSRLRNLFNDFVDCFDSADILYITEVYNAGEAAIEGIGARELVDAISDKYPSKEVYFITDLKEAENIIKNKANPGDMMVMMGAGSISAFANNIAQNLKINQS